MLSWFAVTLEAGKSYEIDLRNNWTVDGALGDPYLYGIHDMGGDLIPGTANDDGVDAGVNSRVVFTPEERGTYYVAAGAAGDLKGTYILSVAEYRDDFVSGTATMGRVTVDGSATGEIEVWGDRDWFAVTLEAGKAYRIDLEGT